jgi:hypothetical protein
MPKTDKLLLLAVQEKARELDGLVKNDEQLRADQIAKATYLEEEEKRLANLNLTLQQMKEKLAKSPGKRSRTEVIF